MSSVPALPGGWWHDFVCPTHGVELGERVEGGFTGSCGCRVAGDAFEGAWLALEHQARAREARVHAHRYRREGDESDRRRAMTILIDYAHLYDRFASEGWSARSEPWMLRGKMFAQALSEAQWAVGIADAVIALDPPRGTDEAAALERMLVQIEDTLRDARRVLVDERDDQRNNYTAWLDAARRIVALARASLGGPEADAGLVAAVYAHMRIAVLPDGWEWEASTYYHVFVLRAYLLSLRGVDPAAIPSDIVRTLRAMVDVLAVIAAPDGCLPILHDGPYDRVAMHREVLEIGALSAQLFERTGLSVVEEWARSRCAADDDGLESTLDGWFGGRPIDLEPAPRRSHLFADAGYAVLRDADARITAVLDAGPHGGAHGHYDKLALYLYGDGTRWQPAPGVPPYASPLRRGYYTRTLAHPTVRVDDADQAEAAAEIRVWDPAAAALTAASATAIEGVDLRRALRLHAGTLVDVVRVIVNDGSRRRLTLGFRPATDFEVRAAGESWSSVWRDGKARLHAAHWSSAPASFTVAPGRGPSDDPSRPRAVGDWTAEAAAADFITVWSLDGGPARSIRSAEGFEGGIVLVLDGDSETPITLEVNL
ncbi:heparinase II/III family protein [Microbacterium awajiense]|uniref:Heparinase II/III family protein n=1 Tax=Microbacterium awajiense TaxID=415214 RepID=A0ABP7ALG8_9MICO